MNKARMKILQALPVILTILFFAMRVSAQQEDLCLWSKFNIEKALSSRISVFFNQETRLQENITRPDELYLETSGTLKAGKGLKFSLGYRFSGKYNAEKYYSLGMRYHHRTFFDINYKVKSSQFTFLYRSRIQEELKNYYSSDKGKVPEWYWRNKFEAKYRIRRFEPYIGLEPHFQIRDPRNPLADYSLNRIWIFAGIDITIVKNQILEIYYMIQREWNMPMPVNKYIIGIEYSINLPHVKHK